MKFIILFTLLTVFSVNGQTFKGKVLDSLTNESIPFATISILELDLSTKSDSSGTFSFNSHLPSDFSIRISATGYETVVRKQLNKESLMVFNLIESHHNLEEVTISGPNSSLQRYNTVHIERRNLQDLNGVSNTTLAEALATIPGVYQSSTGLGISKPVVRGMQGIRVVSLLNGLRVENQQWGGDHGLGITSVGIGSVEVIKGPSSLLYGADALGGVIYYVDENYAPQGKYEIGASTQNESNTLGTTNQLWFKKSFENIRFNLAVSSADHADYQLPDGRFAKNSRFKDRTIKTSFGWNRKKGVMNVRYTYNTSIVGIPGHTHDSIIHEEDLKVNSQERFKILPYQSFQNHFLSIENKWFLEKGEVNFLLGQTLNQLTEFEEKHTIPGIKMNLFNSLYHLKYRRNFTDKLYLISGFQGMYQSNLNDKLASEVLIPNSTSLDNGIYAIGFYDYKKWNFQAGLRFDQRTIKTLEAFKSVSDFNKKYESFNFSTGAVRNSKKMTYRINLSSGYRAPHLSELLADGFHHGALRYEIGNIALKSEKANQIDVTIERHGDHLELILNPFYNFIQNYTYVQPLDSLIEGLPVYEYAQQNRLALFGADLGFHYHPHFAHWLHLESTYSYLQSESVSQISLMPQNRINTTLKFDLDNKGFFRLKTINFNYNYYFKQDRVSVIETPSPSYSILNFSIQSFFGKTERFSLNVGCKNMFNQTFIDHLSRLKNIGLESPGRNIYFKFVYRFNN